MPLAEDGNNCHPCADRDPEKISKNLPKVEFSPEFGKMGQNVYDKKVLYITS